MPGSGSIRWSDAENPYIAETHSGYDDEKKRIRRHLVGPRDNKSADAYYALKDRLEQLHRRQSPRKRGKATSRTTLREYLRGMATIKAPHCLVGYRPCI